MQAGLAVFVLYHFELFVSDSETAAADAVCISADDLTLIVGALDMTLQIVEAYEDILKVTVSVGRKERLPGCAVGYNGRADAV